VDVDNLKIQSGGIVLQTVVIHVHCFPSDMLSVVHTRSLIYTH